MNYNQKVLNLQNEFGISNKKMAEMVGISVSGYAQKRAGMNNQKFTGENWERLIYSFYEKYNKVIS